MSYYKTHRKERIEYQKLYHQMNRDKYLNYQISYHQNIKDTEHYKNYVKNYRAKQRAIRIAKRSEAKKQKILERIEQKSLKQFQKVLKELLKTTELILPVEIKEIVVQPLVSTYRIKNNCFVIDF